MHVIKRVCLYLCNVNSLKKNALLSFITVNRRFSGAHRKRLLTVSYILWRSRFSILFVLKCFYFLVYIATVAISVTRFNVINC